MGGGGKSLGEGLLLAAALQDHGGNLELLPRLQLDLHQLMARLLKGQPAHDGQVDGAPEVDQIRLRVVLQQAAPLSAQSRTNT